MGCSNSEIKTEKDIMKGPETVENKVILFGSKPPKEIEIIKQVEPKHKIGTIVVENYEKKNIESEAEQEIKKSEPKMKKMNAIWIDPNIDKQENSEKLKSTLISLKIKLFKDIYKAVNHLKFVKTNNILVIINEKIYSDFIKAYKENLSDICISPKFYIFSNNEKINMNNNEQIKKYQQIFDQLEGIINKIEEIINILELQSLQQKSERKEQRNQDIQLTFEFIDSKEKLLLPLYFKSLIEKSENDNMEEYTYTLFDKYSQKSKKMKELMDSVKSPQNLQLEKLSILYAKFYSMESGFYKDINESLRLDKTEKYMTFIKILYEGVKLKSLPLASDNRLYRGTKINKDEIEKINSFLKDKKENLPGVIVFCKPFLSFSKDREVAENFLNYPIYVKNTFKALYILDKDDNIGYNLSTHCDLEDFSAFPGEKEVLFFPFSAFEIKSIKEIDINGEKGYEIQLLYLGKYLKEIENDKNIIINENNLPNSDFKNQLIECGLIKKENIENINPKILLKKFKRYENDINNINIITGKINIGPNDINKDIQIINSYENYKRNHYHQYISDDSIYMNEKDILDNIEIKINGVAIEFKYLYQFAEEGSYKIEYKFNNHLTKINNMFSNCELITNLDFSCFNTKNITELHSIFNGCKSLENLDLSYFDTKNITNMSFMFCSCKSLENLDLSHFDTKNVTNMSYMFYGCNSLTNLDLSNFDTKNVTNMSYMFSDCNSLTNLDLSNFDTKNLINMSDMFNNCISLIKINMSNFNTKNVIDMKNIFSHCDSLINLNIPFQYH